MITDPASAAHILTGASRINVIGTSGSGKSTFARQLAALKTVPCVELDALYWRPDWQEPPDADFFAVLETAVSQPCWVLDGNYSRTQDIKWSQAEVVVWIDLGFWMTFWRVTRRALVRSLSREPLWAGNRETLAKAFFSRDSVILWMLTSFRQNRRRYSDPAYYAQYPHLQVVRLRSRHTVRKCLAAVQGAL